MDMTSSVRSGEISNYASVDAGIWAAQRLELDDDERLEFDKVIATSNGTGCSLTQSTEIRGSRGGHA